MNRLQRRYGRGIELIAKSQPFGAQRIHGLLNLSGIGITFDHFPEHTKIILILSHKIHEIGARGFADGNAVPTIFTEQRKV